MTYDIRALTQSDAPALDAFLTPHTDKAYYLRGNALKSGVIYHGNPLEAFYLGAFKDGILCGAIAYSWLQSVLFYADEPACLRPLAEALRPHVVARGKPLSAILGMRDQARFVVEGLGVTRFQSDKKDQLFTLSLDAFQPFSSPLATTRPARADDLDFCVQVRVAFDQEAVAAPPSPALLQEAFEEMSRRIPLRELYILETDGKRASLCGIAGDIPGMKIIGPVYTFPEHRGHGFGKAVVSETIADQKKIDPSLDKIVLFADDPAAIRVYESVGFRYVAPWRFAVVGAQL